MFPVITVDPDSSEAVEPLGTKRKFWFRHDGKRILFKAEERNTGEDWAEKLSCELAGLLGLPHVHYDLAIERQSGTPGVVCESCAPPPSSLVLGNQLLLQRDPNYPMDHSRRYSVKEHTAAAVTNVLTDLAPPLSSLPDGIITALHVFVGYVMLDAWVANQDRHHENWGAIRDQNVLRLAPTFDHGASLARNLTDTERNDRLTTKDAGRAIPHFASRARSAFYENASDNKPVTTRRAWEIFSQTSHESRKIWLQKLSSISIATVEDIFKQIPENRMSNICRTFTLRLLDENRQCLLGDNR